MRYLSALMALFISTQAGAYGLSYVGKVSVTTDNVFTTAQGSMSVLQNPSARPDSYIGFTVASGITETGGTYNYTTNTYPKVAADKAHPIITFRAVDSSTGKVASCQFSWINYLPAGMTEGEAEHLRDAYLRAKEAMSSMNMLSYLGVRYKTGSGYCTYIFHDKSSYMQTTPAGGQSTDY